MTPELRISDAVRSARDEGIAVVALESTIFSGLGLPSPANIECLERCEAAIRGGGAVPALTAVIDGVAVVGVTDAEIERVLAGTAKVAARDLPPRSPWPRRPVSRSSRPEGSAAYTVAPRRPATSATIWSRCRVIRS